MPKYEEHPSKASSWRNGRYVVLPDAEAADLTVWFGIGEHDADDVVWEGLLATRTAGQCARVCAVPFWLYDLNLGDEVSLIESGEGVPVATGILKDAGNLTFRIIFDDAGAEDERWRELMVDLERYECWFDVRTPGFVALSAPPRHGQAVADFLSDRDRSDQLQYETGRLKTSGRLDGHMDH